jgi:rhamnosyltransferase
MANISIIIRTKNEEKWIGHCLNMVFKQSVKDIEVIIVDNNSTDNTLVIANRYPIYKIVSFSDFRPGAAINAGIRVSSGKYIVCISAHCIPKEADWLHVLKESFKLGSNIAGVYGRQLPLRYTSDIDKRDLLIVFGNDRRIQEKDYFFHNANSMILREVWEKHPFDENVTNIEDRVWAKEVISNGWKLLYEPEAPVYHYHGLHQGNNIERARGVVSIINTVDKDFANDLPSSLSPENINVAAVIPIQGSIQTNSVDDALLSKLVLDLKESSFISSIYLVSDSKVREDVNWIDRSNILDSSNMSLNDLLFCALEIIEKGENFPDALLYVNSSYLYRPKGIFDELVLEAQSSGCETVFPALTEFAHFWYKSPLGHYVETDKSLEGRSSRNPVFKSLYGLGCLTHSAVIRKRRLIGDSVRIYALNSQLEAMRTTDFVKTNQIEFLSDQVILKI